MASSDSGSATAERAASRGSTADVDAATRDADVVSQMMREREALLEATTLYRILWPKQDSGESSTDADKGKTGGDSKSADEEEAVPRVPCCGSRGLFRFADQLDIALYIVSAIGSVAHGSIMPAFALIFSQLIDALNDPSSLTTRIDEISLWYVYIGIGSILLAFLEVGLSTIAAERQTARIREAYMDALLRQEVAFYDKEDPGEVASRLTEGTITIQNGVGEKIGNGLHNLATFIVGLALGLWQSWDLTLVVLAFVPLMAIPMAVLKQAKEVLEKHTGTAYARAGSAASEAVSNIRTVVAFNGQEAEARRYAKQLDVAELVSWRGGRVVGAALGVFWLAILGSYSAAFAYGASRIRTSRLENPACLNPFAATTNGADCYTAGTLMGAFFSVIIAAMSVGQVGPDISAFAAAQAAAAKIFAVIERKSAIDPTSRAGIAPTGKARGHIEFKKVTFAYPSNKDKVVLKDFSVVIEPGQTLALVGESGSGKSTTVQLLMRFYDPDSGSILLDGKDIREYDVAWLRSQMGLVSQEPSLFSTSIEENIALGLSEYQSNFGIIDDATKAAAAASTDSATQEASRTGTGKMWGVEVSGHRAVDDLPVIPESTRQKVVEAAKAASVDGFAKALSKGYRTRVGERGGQLSGGQKQRVALARAFIRRPAIFIGDEATSALDSKSEKEVKRAMDKLLGKRSSKADSPSASAADEAAALGTGVTSLLIAHRLSTITNADTILVLDSGSVVESGDHASLIAKGGVYANLAKGQGITADDSEAAAAADAIAAAKDGAVLSEVGLDLDDLAAQRSRATSVASDGSDGDNANRDRSDDLGIIARRISDVLASSGRTGIDRLFFAVLAKATSPAGSAAADSSPTDKPDRPLDADEPRVVLLQSAFLEMALNEKRNFLAWWLRVKAELITELEQAIEKDPSGGAGPLTNALAELTAERPPALLPESAEMIKRCRENKSPIWDAKPERNKSGPVINLPPARSRNALLRGLLLASRPEISMWRVWSFYSSEDTPAIIAALVSSVGDGLVFPMYALALSDMLTVLFKFGDDFEEGVLTYCLLFLAIGAAAGIVTWGRVSFFELIGARLTKRMRQTTYASLLKQEVGYFDYEFNASGQLTGRLSGDAALVRQTSGERVGLLVSNVTALAAGVVIAFTSSWRLSLIMLAVVPFLVLSGVVQMQTLNGFSNATKEALEASAQIASEGMVGIRTVTGLGLQRHVSRSFARSLEGPKRNAFLAGTVGGLALGFSQAVLFCMGYALVFWAGSRFMAEGLIDFNDVSRVFFALTFAATGIGQANSLAGDKSKADAATKSIFSVIDRIPKIAPSSDAGHAIAVATTGSAPHSASAGATPGSAVTSAAGAAAPVATGRIEFKNVTFSYPARPDAVALRNFSAVFEPGTTVGLVGPSGSGKSTIVQLLMRFYDPDLGSITLDGKDIREYDPQTFRDRMGLVSQEPVLFSDSVYYNIAYGRPGSLEVKPYSDLGLATDSHSTVVGEPKEAVVAAASAASAHDFIEKRLPLGYSSFAGMQGSSRLSGGQKQRIAIARAVVDGPGGRTRSMLVGDEATSALDTQSEREVQKALDEMLARSKKDKSDRSYVFVAHRLSTIKEADKIIVLRDGELAEAGTHDELLAEEGLYTQLAKHQQMTLSSGTTEAASASEGAAATTE